MIGLRYLRQLYNTTEGSKEKPSNGPGPGRCGRVSCAYDTAIFWCNDVSSSSFIPSIHMYIYIYIYICLWYRVHANPFLQNRTKKPKPSPPGNPSSTPSGPSPSNATMAPTSFPASILIPMAGTSLSGVRPASLLRLPRRIRLLRLLGSKVVNWR